MIVPEKIQQPYEQMLEAGIGLDLQKRLADKDLTLWSSDLAVQHSISNRLGWIDCIDTMLDQVTVINQIKQDIYARGFRHCVLLGMGGSSLAPELFSKLFPDPVNQDHLSLDVADNTSPDVVKRLNQSLNLKQTLFIVASKSGATIESDSLFRFFYKQIEDADIDKAGQHFIAITDADTALADLANQKDFLHCFINPDDVGGRFSALSYFGLVPAALLGIDIAQLLAAAKRTLVDCQSTQTISDATKLGIILGLAAENNLDKLIIRLSSGLKPFADWLEQLIAESTGKSSKGILPVIETVKSHGNGSNNSFEIRLANQFSTPTEPIFSGVVNITQIGGEFFKWEWATAIAGSLMQINPFDEPNVGENKAITIEQLELPAQSNHSRVDNFTKSAVILGRHSQTILQSKVADLIQSIHPSDYLAILIYGSQDQETASILQALTEDLRNKFSICATLGIGPRYLHSTGQLHKGGANNGVFLIITSGFEQDLAIPDKSFSFAQLNQAQAVGDMQALKTRDRRILHVHTERTDMADLRLLADTICSAAEHNCS